MTFYDLLIPQPHLAADNLELIRDEDANNLLHISASQGHADCLQHLTSLMGEDGLNERNNQQLTPAGLGVKVSVYVSVNSEIRVLKTKKGDFPIFNDNNVFDLLSDRPQLKRLEF